MKRLNVKKGTECMACLACVDACSTAFYKESSNEDKACIRIVEKNGQVKPSVCVQCGKCAKNCPEEAITQNSKGVYVINKNKCTGCGKCAEVCPFGVIVSTSVNSSKCIACGICVNACPMDVLEIVER